MPIRPFHKWAPRLATCEPCRDKNRQHKEPPITRPLHVAFRQVILLKNKIRRCAGWPKGLTHLPFACWPTTRLHNPAGPFSSLAFLASDSQVSFAAISQETPDLSACSHGDCKIKTFYRPAGRAMLRRTDAIEGLGAVRGLRVVELVLAGRRFHGRAEHGPIAHRRPQIGGCQNREA